jgi:hypothetical protein
MKLRFLGRLAGRIQGDGEKGSRGRGRKRVTGLFALAGSVVAVMAVAAACANGSSTGIRDNPDGGSGDDDATSTSTNIPMPVIAGDDASGTSTLPFGDDDDSGGASQGTMIINTGDDDGGEAGTDGGSGGGCAAVGPNFKCGLNPQCGCEGSQTCDVTSRDSGAATCVASSGTIQGDKCTSTSDCQQGLTCILGACRPYCTGQTLGTPCKGSGVGSCAQFYSGGVAVKNDEICFVSCDLTNPTAACGANGCVISSGETNCETVGTAGEFASCTYGSDCAQGLSCITFGSGDSGTSSCRTMCRFGGAACGNNESCTHFSTDLVLNGITYGFCE